MLSKSLWPCLDPSGSWLSAGTDSLSDRVAGGKSYITQCTKDPNGASRSFRISAKAFVAGGGVFQRSGGEVFVPSQVNAAGILRPGMLELASPSESGPSFSTGGPEWRHPRRPEIARRSAAAGIARELGREILRPPVAAIEDVVTGAVFAIRDSAKASFILRHCRTELADSIDPKIGRLPGFVWRAGTRLLAGSFGL